MSERLEITITGRDGVSRTFKAISAEAARTGKSIETAGRQGSRSFDELKRRSTEVGAAIGALAGGIAVLGRSSQNQERQIRGISAAYGDQADEIFALSERIQENTRYSNDAARESALIAASLQQNYGLTTDQIEQVISASADLAAVTGLDLADAVYRTTGAIRGEGEAAERLGLNMSDAAVAAAAAAAGITNWRSGMGEAEKAQFRFNILLEQSAYAHGVAADAADTTAGKTRQYINELQDLGQSAGAALGPVAAVGAEFAPLALALPLVGAGLGKVAGGFATAGKAAASSAVAMRAFALATNPIVLGLAAVGAVAYKVISDYREHEAAVREVEEAYADLRKELQALPASAEVGGLIASINSISDSYADMLNSFSAKGAPIRIVDDRGTEIILDHISAIERLEDTALSLEQKTQAKDLISSIIGETAPEDIDEVSRHLSVLIGLHQEWFTSSGQFGYTADALVAALTQYSDRLNQTGEETEKLTYRTNQFADKWGGLARILSDSATAKEAARLLAFGDMIGEVTNKYGPWLTAANDLADARYANAQAAEAEAAEARAAIIAQQDLAVSYREQLGILPSIVDALGVMSGLQAAGIDWVSGTAEAIRAGFGGEGLLGTIQGLTREADQLGTAFDVIIGGTQRLGQASSQLAGFVDDLFGPDGNAFDGVGPLADLLTAGAISQERFNAAVEAGLDIQQNNVAIQTDLQAIQAQQLPFLADAQEAYTVYIDQLARASDAEQRVALTLMDAGQAAKVTAAFNLAHSASLGELGDAGENTATRMIAAAVEADPFLKETLSELGLISEGARGEVVINFPEADATITTFQELTLSVDALTRALGGIPPPHIGMDTSEFDAGNAAVLGALDVLTASVGTPTAALNSQPFDDGTGGAFARLAELDASSATADVLANTNPFWGSVGGINGQTVGTAYVNLVGLSSSIYGGAYYQRQHGGTLWPDDPPLIPTAQHGINVMVGEAGPELMTVPPGTSVLPHGASKSKLDSMRRPDSGGINFHGPVYLYPATTDVEAAIRADLRGEGPAVKLTGFDGWSWEADGYWCGLPYGIPAFAVQPHLMPRTGATPALAAASVSERTIEAEFGYSGALSYEAAWGALLARLNASGTKPRTLTAERLDGTDVESDALVLLPGGQTLDNSVSSIRVNFLLTDPLWRETTERTISHTVTGIADQGMPLDIGGEAPTLPTIILTGVAVRSVFNSSVGWRYRKSFTITNNTTRTFDRLPVRIGLGDMAAIITATKAQADGDDFLLLLNGKNQARLLYSYNTTNAHMWMIVDGLAPGASRTYDIAYGNGAANFQQLIAYPDLPPFDMGVSTNAKWTYRVQSLAIYAGMGLWHLNRGTRQPSITDRSVPGAWRAFAHTPNQDSFAVFRWLKVNIAGTDYWIAQVQIKRAAKDVIGLVDNQLADAIEVYNPVGITSLYFDYSYQNPAIFDGTPITKFRVLGREGGAGEWEVVAENSTIYATSTAVALTTYSYASPYPTHAALALLPYYENQVPEATSVVATLGMTGTMEVNIDSAGLTIGALSAESPIYDWATNLYLNGFQTPYQAMAVGGYGPGQSRLMIPLFNSVVIDCEKRTVQEWDNTLANKVRDYDDAAWAYDWDLDSDGALVSRLAREWLPITPRTNGVTNPTFATDTTGWTPAGFAGVTVAWSRDAAVFFDAAGSYKVIVSANTNGAGVVIGRSDNGARLPVTEGVKYAMMAAVRTTNLNFRPILAINFYNSGGGLIVTQYEGGWTAVANTWLDRMFEAVAPAGAVTMSVAGGVYGVTANITGTAYFDVFDGQGNHLTWDSLDGGAQVVRLDYHRKYY